MTWFKENKFLGGLIVITLILAILLAFFGITQKGKKEQLLDEVADMQQEIGKMHSIDPFPKSENVREKRKNLKEVLQKGSELQESLLAYAPLALENVSVAQFAETLEKTNTQVRDLYETDETFLPDGFYMGFEQYKGEAPREGATGILTYQLGAFDWLFRELKAAGIGQISNFVRVELAPERGEGWSGAKPGAAKGKNKKSKKKGNRKRPRGPQLPEVAKKLPFELTFTGKEEAVRAALSKIANGEKYFVASRVLAISNPGGIPNNKRLAIAREDQDDEPEEEAEDATGLFDNVDDAPAGEAAEEVVEKSSDSGRLLERVAGGEELRVYLRADLLLFEKEPKFPEVK